jgi:quercetin dioxygenase-like cupin family protein
MKSMVAALLLACVALGSWQVRASDPELTSDFFVPVGVNATTLDGNYFTNSLFRNITVNPGNFATVTPLNQGKFIALTGLGVSSATITFAAGAINPPHTHPRGTELLLVAQGTLDVGLVDTTNKLFTQTLQAGDSFVFPKGLVHFQINNGNQDTVAVAAFSSSNPGLVHLPNTLFKSNINDDILAKAFGVTIDVIKQLKKATVV